MISRRTFLLGGVGGAAVVAAGGVGAVEEGVLPGRIRMHEALGLCAVSSHWADGVTPAPTRSIRYTSLARGRDVEYVLVVPPGRRDNDVAGLPVVFVLHGLGDTPSSGLAAIDLPRGLAHHVAGGGMPFALVAVDGGTTYWHPRGLDDPLAMLSEEILPRLRLLGADTHRLGSYGWSMGGAGSLLLAREGVGGTRLTAAAAASPAVFPTYAAVAPGSYDDAADWARWGDLVSRPPTGVPTLIDCGDTDAFTAVTTRLLATVTPRPTGRISSGCHQADYWRSLVPAQLSWLGAALAA